MRALILAGGFGTRLRPLTYTRPKHLLPIANRPHIEHVLRSLQASGVDEAVLMTSYLADAFGDTVERAKSWGFTMHVTHEEEPLGTAGAIKNAERFARDDTVLVMNGDVLTDIELTELARFHRDRGAEATILLVPVEDPSRFGVVPTDDDGRVERFIEKPPPGEAVTNLINAGVYVFEPSILDRIPSGEVWSTEHQLFPGLIDEGAALYATSLPGYWRDIGTPRSLLEANLDAVGGVFRTDAVTEIGSPLIDPSATVDPAAEIAGSCIGAGVSIDSGASVTDSVLLPGVSVGEGADISTSILGAGVTVSPDAHVKDHTAGDGEVLS
ncbi:MAG TPA: NDP-sugar synthase [Actinomycetota bacterium]|nr:NDP-sugar synthase [Actinomycetota bacterium]